MTTTFKPMVTRPTHLGPKPRSAASLLRQTHAYLTEEGKWIKGHMFKDGSAKKAYERGFCDNWGVCSVGALGIVSGEFTPGVVEAINDYGDWEDVEHFWSDDYYANDSIVAEACAYLSLVINPSRAYDAMVDGFLPNFADEWTDIVINWNDDGKRKRKQVLDAFAEAAALAAKRGSFDAIARKHLASKGYDTEEF